MREMSPQEIAEKAAAARLAQAVWRRYSLSQRVSALRAWWEALEKDRGQLAAVVHGETGRPLAEISAMEIDAAALLVKFFTRNAHRILQDRAAPRPWIFLNKRMYTRHLPRGIVGLLTPWNLPFLIPFGDALPALLAGNAVLLKPSELATETALYLEDRFNGTGLFPQGLFQVAPGGPEAGTAVVRGADMVVFTGSAKNGRKVAALAAERLIPAVLELGGKHAMIVARDAGLRRAAKAAVWGRFANSGQLCTAVERIFVEEPVYAEFIAALSRETAALRQSLEPTFDADLGRLISPLQLEAVERHLEDARSKGAKVEGGKILDREKLVVSPALVLGATPEMLVMREETFGPVLPVMAVKRLDDAVRLANESPFGMAASLWTRDLARAEQLGALIEAGLLGINETADHYMVCSLPFGGLKESGLGRRNSDEGLRMYCHPQAVIVHEWPADAPDPWWFPYSRVKARLLSLLVRLS